MAKMKACPVCGQKVGIDRLESHVKKVHPKENVEVQFDQEEQKEVKQAKKAYKPSAGPKGRRLVIIAVIIIVVVVLAFVLMPRGLRVGDPAPDFTLKDTANQNWELNVRLEAGAPILLEFFHPQCSACIYEVNGTSAPLKLLYGDYGTNVEFVSIAITLENPEFTNPPTLSMVNQFKSTFSTPWTYLLEASGTSVRDQYGISGTPTFYLVGTDGKIAFIHVGSGNLADLRNAIISELTP